jgi:class 3 adenylate cyclase
MPEERMERRLAAILAADIAGYSALMGADEARTVRDLKGHQAVVLPMVGEFSGRIIDTAGDGILAEFASVVNAVQCALAIPRTRKSRVILAKCCRERRVRRGKPQCRAPAQWHFSSQTHYSTLQNQRRL